MVSNANRAAKIISPDERLQIGREFWRSGNVEKQREFVIRHIDEKDPRRPQVFANKRKKRTLIYNLTVNNEKTKVCKEMFLHTLAISSTFVNVALEKKKSDGTVEEDKQGKHLIRNRIDEITKEQIREHIQSFPTKEAHYVRRDSQKKYLEEDLSINRMYSLYAKKCDDNGISKGKKWIYTKIFNEEFNIAFAQPKKDLCSFCEEFNKATGEKKAQLQEAYNNHMTNKNLVREKKEKDKQVAKNDPETYRVAVFDLQQVLPCPLGEASMLFYNRQLSVYNLTVFEMCLNIGHNFMWHEGIAARGANDIGSCVFRYLQMLSETTVREVVFYSDCCGGQNRNRFIPTMYMHALEHTSISKITHRFLESGRTHNEGDSVHSVIERKKKKATIYTPQQYYTLVRMAKSSGPPFQVHEMETANFFDFKRLAAGKNYQLDKAEDGSKVAWNQIKELEVNSENMNKIFLRYSHDDCETITINLTPRRRGRTRPDTTQLQCTYQGPQPIAQAKMKDLQKLKKSIIPAQYHHFYDSLVVVEDSSSDDDSEST